MTVNHSKSIKLLYPYCACHTKKEMHSRGTTVYCDLMSCTTSAFFRTFFRFTMVPTLVENF